MTFPVMTEEQTPATEQPPAPAARAATPPRKKSRLLSRLRRSSPRSSPNRLDQLLLRWGVLSIVVLLITMVLLVSGSFEPVDSAQLHLLCGTPFYLEAEATQHSALSPAHMFLLCVGVTLYLSLVLLREKKISGRTQTAVAAVVASALPGLLCVLWDCVFYAAPLICCVLLSWLFSVTIPFFRNNRA